MFEHFVIAQDPVYDGVRAELRAGRKASHWMWFIFPQLRGLGKSPIAERFALSSLDEARDYLGHEILGPRLVESTALVLSVQGRTAHDIFGSPDDLKFHSSMTLFARVAPGIGEFRAAIDKYYGGEEDQRTLELLAL